MNEKVAIVVLSHNAWIVSEKFLQHYQYNTDLDQVHLVWIDNGSDDNSPRNLENYRDKNIIDTLMLTDTNYGVIGGRNMGFEYFLNDLKDYGYLCFLDNDQFVKDGWLEHHMSVLHSGYDLIGVEAWVMSANFLPIMQLDSIAKRFTYVGCGGSLMRRKVPETVGTYDERFNPCYFEDPDFCFRCLDAGFKIGWNYSAKIDHLPHQTLGSIGNKRENFLKSLKEFKTKWRGKKNPSLLQRDLPEFRKN